MGKDEKQLPEFDKIKTMSECDVKIASTEATIARKYKLRRHSEEAKKDMAASYTEQIKQLIEDLEHELACLDGYLTRKKLLGVQGTVEDEDVPHAPTLKSAKSKMTGVPFPTDGSVLSVPFPTFSKSA